MHQLPQHMIERFVDLLNEHWITRRNNKTEIKPALFEQSTIRTGQSKREQAHPPAQFKRLGDVLTGAIKREPQRDIPRPGQRLEMLSKPLLRRAPGQSLTERRAVIGQRDGRQGALANNDRVHKLDGNVLSIGRARAIAEGQESSTLVKTTRHSLARRRDRVCLGVKEGFRQRYALLKTSSQDCLQLLVMDGACFHVLCPSIRLSLSMASSSA